MNWKLPHFAHIPLIHGSDGAKLSKRHGALGVEAYRDRGYLPEALRNYLLRLGWSHGDHEIISTKEAIEWFNLDHVGKSPARFDFVKLENLNGHYIREMTNEKLLKALLPFIEKKGVDVSSEALDLLKRGMNGLKQRAKTMVELADNSLFYIMPPTLDEAAKKLLATPEDQEILKLMEGHLASLPEVRWTEKGLEDYAREIAEEKNLKLGKIAQPLRAALTGKTVSPSVFEILHVFGKDKSLERLIKNISSKIN